MFDIGWDELVVIAVVALVVIGPKDLPYVFRTVAKWLGKARALAREFQDHVDDLMRETQVDELKREFQGMTRPPELEGLDAEVMTGRAPQQPKPAVEAAGTAEPKPAADQKPAPEPVASPEP